MGDYFRSQPMTLVQLVIPFDVAHDTVDELGKIGVVQFQDVRFLFFEIFVQDCC
jgi:vacuolar-type H+-ATPase subunit I/STV1